MSTLKEEIESGLEQQYKDTEGEYYGAVYQVMVEVIKDNWTGRSLRTPVKKSDITSHGKIRPDIDEYINIVDRVCSRLNEDSYLAGFKFQRSGSGQDDDGYWGETVDIYISSAG